MTILNVSQIVQMMGGKNQYSYTRVKNLLMGLKGRSSKKEIQAIRKIIQRELSEVDSKLAKLENE